MRAARVGMYRAGGQGKEKSTMAEQEIRATHQEVEGFVGKLRDFHHSLSESEQAMLETVLEGAQAKDTGGYFVRYKRYGDPDEQQGDTEREGGRGWNDLVGWIEEQGEEDTQGFFLRVRV